MKRRMHKNYMDLRPLLVAGIIFMPSLQAIGQTQNNALENLFRNATETFQRVLESGSIENAELDTDSQRLQNAEKAYLQANELYQKGFVREALNSAEKSLEIRQELLGSSAPPTIESMQVVGRISLQISDLARAQQVLKQVCDIHEEGKNPAHIAMSQHDLGFLYLAMSDVPRAKQHFEKAVRYQKKVSPANDRDLALFLTSLAQLEITQGTLDVAEVRLTEALSVLRELSALAHKEAKLEIDLELASTHVVLGTLYQMQGSFDKAEQQFKQALQIRIVYLQPDHPSIAVSIYLRLGQLYQAMNRPQQAEVELLQALASTQKYLGKDHFSTAQVSLELGTLHIRQNKFTEAEPLIRHAIEGTIRQLDLQASAQSSRQQFQSAEILRRHIEAYLSLDIDEQAYQYLLDWKGRVLSRQRAQAAIARRPELTELADRYRLQSHELSVLSKTPRDQSSQADWQTKLDQLWDQREQVEVELARRCSEFGRPLKTITLQQLQQRLDKQTALIDFFKYRHLLQSKREGGRALTETRYVAFVVLPSQDLVRINLGQANKIDEAIKTWRTTYRNGRQLRQLLWDPLETHLQEAKHILLSPDGAIASFPFAALPGSQPDTYLIEEYSFASIPVPRLLPASKAKSSVPQRNSILIVGEVDYDADSAQPSKDPSAPLEDSELSNSESQISFTALKFSPFVTNYLSTIDQQISHVSPTVLRGEKATEAAFREAIKSSNYVHIATHGYFAPNRLLSHSAGGLPEHSADAASDPGLHSGMALAGANNKSKVDTDDGILTAMEIATLDLLDLELATLSACETGLGKDVSGEGLLGIQRSFQIAGARNVVSSLWNVQDKATAILMKQFYQQLWIEKKPPREALRQAQLALLRNPQWTENSGSTRAPVFQKTEKVPNEPSRTTSEIGMREITHPRYWAAFVISGIE